MRTPRTCQPRTPNRSPHQPPQTTRVHTQWQLRAGLICTLAATTLGCGSSDADTAKPSNRADAEASADADNLADGATADVETADLDVESSGHDAEDSVTDAANVTTDGSDLDEASAPDKTPAADAVDGLADETADGGNAMNLAFPGALPLAGALRMDNIQLLDDMHGCDWDGDGVPNNAFGKLVNLYAAINDALKDSNPAFALLPTIDIGMASLGTAFDASFHQVTVDANGALWLDPSSLKPSVTGAAAKFVAQGVRVAAGFVLET